MITRTPEDEERIKELTKELAKLVESNDELYLLVTFIREFFRVKEEYKVRRLKQVKLEIIKPRRQTCRPQRKPAADQFVDCPDAKPFLRPVKNSVTRKNAAPMDDR